jgi:transposase
MALIRSRQALVGSRTQLVNHVRGAVKSFGARLPRCPARSFHNKAAEHIPEALWPALGPILQTIGSLSQRIRDYERELETISREHYPETELLRQLEGIGPLTALTFVLTLEDPYRFERSRSVGAYLGLVPASDQSGDRDPQRHISKEGDEMLRRLLVGSSHYILGPFGSDSDLRRHGEKIASRGGKNAKKRAVVAVARKEKALGALAPPVGEWRGLRPTLQHPSAPRGGAQGSSLKREAMEFREAKEEEVKILLQQQRS